MICRTLPWFHVHNQLKYLLRYFLFFASLTNWISTFKPLHDRNLFRVTISLKKDNITYWTEKKILCRDRVVLDNAAIGNLHKTFFYLNPSLFLLSYIVWSPPSTSGYSQSSIANSLKWLFQISDYWTCQSCGVIIHKLGGRQTQGNAQEAI